MIKIKPYIERETKKYVTTFDFHMVFHTLKREKEIILTRNYIDVHVKKVYQPTLNHKLVTR